MVWGPYWNCSVYYYYYDYSPKWIAIFKSLKLINLFTRLRTGKNVHLIWVSAVGVAKWLDSSIYNISKECASSYVLRTLQTCNTITYKKVSWNKIQNPTGSTGSRTVLAISKPRTLTDFSYSFNQIVFKFAECIPKAFAKIQFEDLKFSSRGVSLATWPWNRKFL